MEVASEFESVLKNLKNIDMDALELSDTIKLDFYKFYKQATMGDCTTSEPYSIFFRDHAKWKAWDSIKGMSTEDAMKEYINHYNCYIK